MVLLHRIGCPFRLVSARDASVDDQRSLVVGRDADRCQWRALQHQWCTAPIDVDAPSAERADNKDERIGSEEIRSAVCTGFESSWSCFVTPPWRRVGLVVDTSGEDGRGAKTEKRRRPPWKQALSRRLKTQHEGVFIALRAPSTASFWPALAGMRSQNYPTGLEFLDFLNLLRSKPD